MSTYADVDREARAAWLNERPPSDDPHPSEYEDRGLPPWVDPDDEARWEALVADYERGAVGQ